VRTLGPGEVRTIYYNVVSNGDLDDGTYSLDLILTYKDEYDLQYDTETKVYLPLEGIGSLQTDFAFDNLVYPHTAGRQYLAYPTAAVEWNNDRIIVGTADAQIAIINGEDVFALGPCASYGPVRSMCTNKSRTRLWGTAGDEEDLGTVFYYDDKVGLRQLGFLIYNIHGYIDGPSASNILSCIALSPDESLIAVGGADRIGSIHIARI